MNRNRLYRKGVLVAEDFPTEQISDCLAEADSVVWLDLESPDEHERSCCEVSHQPAIRDAPELGRSAWTT